MKTNAYLHLVNILRLVASPYSIQMSFFPVEVLTTDEISLDYYDAFLQANGLYTGEEISLPVYIKLKELNNEFQMMSKSPTSDFWSESALKNDPTWERIRATAVNILKLMGEEYTKPDKDSNISFII